jgi:type I phosphodiesterase/nucleotide pyrophosphatase
MPRIRGWRRATALLLALGCAPGAAPSPDLAPEQRRAIFVSFDSMNEERARTTVDPAAIPNLLRLFDQASCADGSRPMWPSVTAASHAALWTGVYGNVNGVVANSMAPLPWSEFSLLDELSGFEPRQLNAEPIWIAAARGGRSAVENSTTHAGLPGHWKPEGGRDTAKVRRDSAALADPRLLAITGYTSGPAGQLLTAGRSPPGPAGPWRNLGSLGTIGVPLREIAWAVGRDSLFALFFGADRYTGVAVGQSRDVARAVRVHSAPVERAPVDGERELARHFSGVLWLTLAEGRAGVYFRLWDLAPDLSSFQLFQSVGRIMRGNHAEALRTFEDAVGGFVANPSDLALRNTEPMLEDGGDGTAELKFLETAELQTRQAMRGSEWLWRNRRPDLQTEYFSLADGLDHLWYGLIAPEVPGRNPELAARVNAVRSRGWAMVDRRLAHLWQLARQEKALLVVAGDHGMRATWRLLHVNAVLRRAGLLVADTGGRPDLERSRALAPNGPYVTVNRIGRKGGIVPPSEVNQVADSVIRALLAVRGPDGRPVVTRTWRPAPDDTLGIGGPTGGDVYFNLAPGYYYSTAAGDALTGARAPGGSHGFPSIEPDMRTVLCAIGPGVGGRRLPTARVIDAAPTVAEWIGVAPPGEAKGVSLLGAMRGR